MDWLKPYKPDAESRYVLSDEQINVLTMRLLESGEAYLINSLFNEQDGTRDGRYKKHMNLLLVCFFVTLGLIACCTVAYAIYRRMLFVYAGLALLVALFFLSCISRTILKKYAYTLLRRYEGAS